MMAFVFFFNDTATTEIYTLSLHDALPISCAEITSMLLATPAWKRSRAWRTSSSASLTPRLATSTSFRAERRLRDRKSTRLNSSHSQISYAVFCLKKKKLEGARHLVAEPAR